MGKMSLGLAASTGCDPGWWLPPLSCASAATRVCRAPAPPAVRAGGWSHHPPGARQGESTPLKTSRPVNVVTVSQGELRRANKRTQRFSIINTFTGKCAYPKICICSLSLSLGYFFPPYIEDSVLGCFGFRFCFILGFFFICILTIQRSFFIIHRIVNGKCTWRWTGMKLQ